MSGFMVYLAMAIVGLVSGGVVIFGRRDPALLATFFVSAAAILVSDWVVHGWFQLYLYHPSLSNDIVTDSTLGVLLSEVMFVPGLYVLSLALAPGWKAIALNTLLVTLMEEVYRRVGLFSQHGWEIWYTAVGFPIYFGVVQRFWVVASKAGLHSPQVRRLARAGVCFLLSASLAATLKMTRAVITHLNVLPTDTGNQSLGVFPTHGLMMASMAYWVVAGERRQRLGRLVICFVVWMTANWLMVVVHYRTFTPPWNPVFDATAQAGVAYLICLVDDWISMWAHSPPRVLKRHQSAPRKTPR